MDTSDLPNCSISATPQNIALDHSYVLPMDDGHSETETSSSETTEGQQCIESHSQVRPVDNSPTTSSQSEMDANKFFQPGSPAILVEDDLYANEASDPDANTNDQANTHDMTLTDINGIPVRTLTTISPVDYESTQSNAYYMQLLDDMKLVPRAEMAGNLNDVWQFLFEQMDYTTDYDLLKFRRDYVQYLSISSRRYRPYVEHMIKAHSNVLMAVMEHDVSVGIIKHVDIFLTAMSCFLNDNICLMLPSYVWLTEDMYHKDDVRDFQYFLIVDKGSWLFAMKEETLIARGISFPSIAEDEKLLSWMKHPDTGKCIPSEWRSRLTKRHWKGKCKYLDTFCEHLLIERSTEEVTRFLKHEVVRQAQPAKFYNADVFVEHLTWFIRDHKGKNGCKHFMNGRKSGAWGIASSLSCSPQSYLDVFLSVVAEMFDSFTVLFTKNFVWSSAGFDEWQYDSLDEACLILVAEDGKLYGVNRQRPPVVSFAKITGMPDVEDSLALYANYSRDVLGWRKDFEANMQQRYLDYLLTTEESKDSTLQSKDKKSDSCERANDDSDVETVPAEKHGKKRKNEMQTDSTLKPVTLPDQENLRHPRSKSSQLSSDNSANIQQTEQISAFLSTKSKMLEDPKTAHESPACADINEVLPPKRIKKSKMRREGDKEILQEDSSPLANTHSVRDTDRKKPQGQSTMVEKIDNSNEPQSDFHESRTAGDVHPLKSHKSIKKSKLPKSDGKQILLSEPSVLVQEKKIVSKKKRKYPFASISKVPSKTLKVEVHVKQQKSSAADMKDCKEEKKKKKRDVSEVKADTRHLRDKKILQESTSAENKSVSLVSKKINQPQKVSVDVGQTLDKERTQQEEERSANKKSLTETGDDKQPDTNEEEENIQSSCEESVLMYGPHHAKPNVDVVSNGQKSPVSLAAGTQPRYTKAKAKLPKKLSHQNRIRRTVLTRSKGPVKCLRSSGPAENIFQHSQKKTQKCVIPVKVKTESRDNVNADTQFTQQKQKGPNVYRSKKMQGNDNVTDDKPSLKVPARWKQIKKSGEYVKLHTVDEINRLETSKGYQTRTKTLKQPVGQTNSASKAMDKDIHSTEITPPITTQKKSVRSSRRQNSDLLSTVKVEVPDAEVCKKRSQSEERKKPEAKAAPKKELLKVKLVVIKSEGKSASKEWAVDSTGADSKRHTQHSTIEAKRKSERKPKVKSPESSTKPEQAPSHSNNQPTKKEVKQKVKVDDKEVSKETSVEEQYRDTFKGGDKKFQCDKCTRRFSHKKTLVDHVANIHNNVIRFRCSKCGKGFFASSPFKAHEARCLGLKNYACGICHQKFFTTSDLTLHVKSNHSEERLQCRHCDKTFQTKETLRVHLNNIQMDKKYTCQRCTGEVRVFAQYQGLYKHYVKNHQDNMDELKKYY